MVISLNPSHPPCALRSITRTHTNTSILLNEYRIRKNGTQQKEAVVIALLRLVLDPLDPLANSVLITEVSPPERRKPLPTRNNVHIIVQLVHQRHPRRNIELRDLRLIDPVQVLDQRPQRVPMRRNEHVPPRREIGRDIRLVERQHAVQRGLERLGELRGEVLAGVPRVVGGVVGRGEVDGGGWYVVAAAPDEDLVLAVLVDGFLFVEALEGSVVAFVELPVFFDGDPQLVGLVEDDEEGFDGAAEETGVGDFCFDSGGFD